MASPKVAEALGQARQAADPPAAYKAMLKNIQTLSPQTRNADDLIAIADQVFGGDPLGVVVTRALLGDFITTLGALEKHDTWIQAGQHIVRLITTGNPLASSLVEQIATLRELVATAHEANEDFLDAAKVLCEIPLDSSQRRVPDAEKAAVWIRIVRNYLEVDDSTTAETYLNKLKNVMHDVDDAELSLHFRLSAARIQDSNRQFLQAAKSYHDLSFLPAIAEEERLHTLAMAIKCAILAPAGPMRSRALGRLYKDERSAGLDEYGILEKMFFDRLLSATEVDKFAQDLAPHQLAKTSDGSTVLAKAVVEHNLLSASRLYSNIGFDELGLLLGLGGSKAEDTTAKMIEQGRLSGSIDQIDRIIWFGGGEASGEKGSGRAEVLVGKEMQRWDSNVQALAEDVERLTDALQAEFPEFVAARIAA
ncbi:hypothetical protein BT67DRAFT_444489 [Trichocladium antarcticum]|uniref:COP9 signalosome complex subunit 4 n=1 Tax=Trichocladium antarcticum TaxID=1450529 RepID=A0AAN6ZB23_9PEZI|nr:hypothetical protein BT67DRAFT_444489 [Trichocladium antarcticum]